MASMIEVTQDVIYELSGEKVIMPADSIIQSISEFVETPTFKGVGETCATLFTSVTQAGAVVWRVTVDYGVIPPTVDAVELVECPEGVEIIQSLAVEIVDIGADVDG